MLWPMKTSGTYQSVSRLNTSINEKADSVVKMIVVFKVSDGRRGCLLQ